tara:strand:+ start:2027 stop:2500 length:474 start_codon:yes stop_codon:yes gene_type:complete
MGNLADKRRLRKEAGEKIYKGDAVISDKDEMMFIPFIQSGNPDEERPWLYKGYYRMPDGAINMELKRMEGQIELKVESIDNYKDYLHTAVESFVKKIYEESTHDAKTISMEKHETEVDVLKKEIIRLQIDAENATKVNQEAKALLERMTRQRGMTRE